MNTRDCIKTRKSSRKFLSTEVPKEVIREVVEDAMQAPSYKNSQPWEVAVVAGAKKDELSLLLNRLLTNNVKPLPDIDEPPVWPDFIQKRIVDTMIQRSQAFGTKMQDSNAAIKSKQANFNFYGAPAGLFFYQDASLGLWSLLDIGMFIENVILGFHDRGLATVPQAFLIDYSAQVKEFLNLPAGKRLVLGMSIGYPDYNDIRSIFASPRTGVDEILHWV